MSTSPPQFCTIQRLLYRVERLHLDSRFCVIGNQNEKFDRIDFEDISQLFQHVDRGGMFFPFEHTDIISIDFRTIGQLLLRQALGATQHAQISGDPSSQSHAKRSP